MRVCCLEEGRRVGGEFDGGFREQRQQTKHDGGKLKQPGFKSPIGALKKIAYPRSPPLLSPLSFDSKRGKECVVL